MSGVTILIILVFAFVLAVVESFVGRPERPAYWPWLVPHLGWLAIALFILVEILQRSWRV
jgi:tryptophan-rich sensory protein